MLYHCIREVKGPKVNGKVGMTEEPSFFMQMFRQSFTKTPRLIIRLGLANVEQNIFSIDWVATIYLIYSTSTQKLYRDAIIKLIAIITSVIYDIKWPFPIDINDRQLFIHYHFLLFFVTMYRSRLLSNIFSKNLAHHHNRISSLYLQHLSRPDSFTTLLSPGITLIPCLKDNLFNDVRHKDSIARIQIFRDHVGS